MGSISAEIKADLSEAVRTGNVEGAIEATRRALDGGVDPLELIRDVLVPTLIRIGEAFQSLEIFLPELILAGEAAKESTHLLEEVIRKQGREVEVKGTVVIGTVEGDIHDIGKNIVASLLNAHGFRVIDLGKDVSADTFIDEAEKNRADVIAMSALMNTTRPGQKNTIQLMEEIGVRKKYKVIVGGGSVNQSWADEIGADGFAENAPAAAQLCQRLVGGR